MLAAIEQGYSVCAYSGELTKEKFQEWINLQCAGSDYIGLKYDPVRNAKVPTVPYVVQERLLEYYRDRFYLYEMADGGFTVHEIAIAVWLCTGGWDLREIERRMNNLISTCENVTKGM